VNSQLLSIKSTSSLVDTIREPFLRPRPMTLANPATASEPPPPRRGRALAAWLTAEHAARLDPSGAIGHRQPTVRATLAARPDGVAQGDLIAEWPAALEPHASALRASPGARTMFDEGWRPALITDLRRVVAAQPTVFVDEVPGQAAARMSAVPSLDELARLTLPLEAPASNISARFDEEQQLWVVTSPDPNVRITGTFGKQVLPNVVGIGFFIEARRSFVSVAEVDGRHVLRDGYHRCYRLIAAGVTAVPAFVRRYDDAGAVFTSPMLDRDIWCGPKPPTLADYHDDRVAADISVAPAETTAVVAAGPRRLSLARVPAAA